uniref:Protein kinase domain-containing protein n=2 Tax=Palpitomonas bilix TaxID=652834 RepID=A0A7S3G953_9EUKA|mmetsp:Transcript_29791/g.76918  ORF Transcript_29791/g.76918 Transcript_29791/m.76918 type:complete len:421 (+) Transcript_29791:146-1408(+)
MDPVVENSDSDPSDTDEDAFFCSRGAAVDSRPGSRPCHRRKSSAPEFLSQLSEDDIESRKREREESSQDAYRLGEGSKQWSFENPAKAAKLGAQSNELRQSQQPSFSQRRGSLGPDDAFLCGRVGRSLGRLEVDFRILDTLGQGAFGKVLRVQHNLDRATYAVKVTTRKIRGHNSAEVCLREVHALAALADVSEIVRYFGSWIDRCADEGSSLYIQLEYCRGGNLQTILEKGIRFSEMQVLRIFKQVCYGLSQAHSRRIAHLDIKPENILLSLTPEEQDLASKTRAGEIFPIENFKVKIGDWGMSAPVACGHVSIPDGLDGDSRYLAREMLGSKIPDECLPFVDVFALGLSMCELLGGAVPKEGQPWQDIRSNGDLPRNMNGERLHVTEPLHAILKDCLHPDPSQRPSSERLLHTLVDKL